MIITRLTLHNFGVYANDNTFVFHGEKPVVLIGGMNGRGKTTFLEAVLLGLYGSSSFAFNESDYKSYGQYLKAFVNKADGTLMTFVELEFKLDSETKDTYIINRSWSGKGQRIRENLEVRRNGEHNQFLTDNWSMFIENILPSGLSNFFFFDGEKIAELALDNTNAQMKESIKNLLGISVLDVLENDLSRIVSRTIKASGNAHNSQELEKLKENKEHADVALQVIDDRISELTSRLDETSKSLEKAKSYYTTHGGDIVSQQQDLFNQRNYLSASIDQIQENLLDMAAGELPLLMVVGLLRNIKTQAEKEHESKVMDYAVSRMKSLLDQYSLVNGNGLTGDDSILSFISYIEKQAEKEKTVAVYNLSESAMYQVKNLLSSGLPNSKKKTFQEITERNKKKTQADQIDSYLSVDIDEKSLAKAYKKIKTLEQEIIDLSVKIEAEKKRRAGAHGEAIRANTEYKNFVESLLKNLELNDDRDRLLKYSHQAIDILQEYRIRLQRKKIDILASTMTECYKKLANKKNLIEHIIVSNKTLDFTYLDSNNEIIPNSSLSAGERQLMVISLLWALAICSRKELPIIIDTPLSRLDSNHRVSLVTTYFPQASKQTIILSTDSEIDQRYYDLMKENVGDEFTLIYDDQKKCSTINQGYFMEDKNDNSTN